jgi:Sporulation and spore germination
MNRRQAWIAGAAAAVLLAAGLLYFLGDADEESADGLGDGVTPVDENALPLPEESFTANLYFPDGGVQLHAESRELPPGGSVEERVAALVGALLAGPEDGRFLAPLPQEVTLRKVYLIDGTTVFLDLESPDGGPPPASGSLREMLTVYSLVDTVLLNTEGPERVVLLWNGQQPKTFAGHLDTGRPLLADSRLIAGSP